LKERTIHSRDVSLFAEDQTPGPGESVAQAFSLTFAGVGLRSNFREMRKQGLRPFAVGAIGEVVIAVFTLALVAGAGRIFGFKMIQHVHRQV